MHHARDTQVGKSACDQAKDTNRGNLEHDVDHGHHYGVELLEDRFTVSTLLPRRPSTNPRMSANEDDLKPCAVVHRLDDVGRDDVDERFCHAHFGAGSCGVGHDDRGQVKTHTWRDQLGKADRDEHGESSGDDIHEQRADAHFPSSFGSAIAAAPHTIEQKTSGITSICIRRMNP